MFGFALHEAIARSFDEALFEAADPFAPDGPLHLEDEAGADGLDDRRRSTLLAMFDVVEVPMIARVDERHRAAAGVRRDAVLEEVLAGYEDAGRSGPADHLVR